VQVISEIAFAAAAIVTSFTARRSHFIVLGFCEQGVAELGR
jgi:hypothetical protein